VNLHQLLSTLGARGVISIWAEGGGTLLGALLEGEHLDEVAAFIAPVLLGSDGLPAVNLRGPALVADAWRLRDPRLETLGDDVLVRGYVGKFDA
jgi:diaminohydroxyphosphoribosylaminopyrimidine deaminase/5-amino-6-(5-phosphoribosylamino)uracil reductase